MKHSTTGLFLNKYLTKEAKKPLFFGVRRHVVPAVVISPAYGTAGTALTDQGIAERIQEYLLEQLRAVIPCERSVVKYLCDHHRLCLCHDDRSEEPHWYRVWSREQVLEISKYFCPEILLTEQESLQILNTVIAGACIDFSKPTYMTYDLNRMIPILN